MSIPRRLVQQVIERDQSTLSNRSSIEWERPQTDSLHLSPGPNPQIGTSDWRAEMESTRLCSVEGCDRKRSARGMCNLHYQRNLKHGDPLWEPMTMEDRFWAKVLPTGFCWEWTGALDPNGYGVFNVGDYVDRAHRVSYSILVGEIPNGYHVDHLCRNPKCCNPDHLEPVPPSENIRRGYSPAAIIGRTGLCARGHSMVDAYVRPDIGTRMCRTCSVERGRNRDRGHAAPTS